MIVHTCRVCHRDEIIEQDRGGYHQVIYVCESCKNVGFHWKCGEHYKKHPHSKCASTDLEVIEDNLR